MKNNLLIKEDGYICNGIVALKEKYVLVNKNLNVDFVTLLEMAEINKMLLNPKWKTIIDGMQIEEKYTKLSEIICINQKFFVFLQKILEVQ